MVSPCIWGAKDDDDYDWVGEKAINFKTLDYVGHEGRFRIAGAFNFVEHVAFACLDYRYVRCFGGRFSLRYFCYYFWVKFDDVFLIVSACFWFLGANKKYILFFFIRIYLYHSQYLLSNREKSFTGEGILGIFNRFMVLPPRVIPHRHSNRKINNLFCRN